MFDFWADDLTEEETETLIEKAAVEIEKRKLVGPAVLFFESHKPLSFVSSQAAVAFAPFITPVLGYDFVNNYSRLLAKKENIERLLVRLEEGPKPSASVEES